MRCRIDHCRRSVLGLSGVVALLGAVLAGCGSNDGVAGHGPSGPTANDMAPGTMSLKVNGVAQPVGTEVPCTYSGDHRLVVRNFTRGVGVADPTVATVEVAFEDGDTSRTAGGIYSKSPGVTGIDISYQKRTYGFQGSSNSPQVALTAATLNDTKTSVKDVISTEKTSFVLVGTVMSWAPGAIGSSWILNPSRSSGTAEIELVGRCGSLISQNS